MKIATKVQRIIEKREDLLKQLMVLQEECTHPNVHKKGGSNTGNYDPSADAYWWTFNCPDCIKYWREDQ